MQIKIGNKRTHQTGLADTGCQGKTDRWKISLKIRACRIRILYLVKLDLQIDVFLQSQFAGQIDKYFQTFCLRHPQAQAVFDGSRDTIHFHCLPVLLQQAII